MKLTGKNLITKRNDGAKGSNVCKITVEKLYTDDYKNLIQYGAEKDLEQVEGNERKFRVFSGVE